MIVRTDGKGLLAARVMPCDLSKWHDDIGTIDWDQTLAQPNWHLITDGDHSFCLIEPRWLPWSSENENHFEAHLIIAPWNRGAEGLEIARDMLDWIDTQTNCAILYAKTTERKTRLFLRWLGFRPDKRVEGQMLWTPNVRRDR